MNNALSAMHPYRRQITLLFQAALLTFTFTVAVGALNGMNLMEFVRPALLTHVHAGTLGWITLGVLAISLWLFGEGDQPAAGRRFLAAAGLFAILTFAVYAYAFWANEPGLRAATSVAVLLAIACYFAWMIARIRRIRMGIAHWALLGAMINLTVGAVIGSLLQYQMLLERAILPDGAFLAHPTTMVIGYLILVGMAITEWQFMPPSERLPRAGLVQIGLPFLGGVLITLGALFDIQPLLFMNVPLEILGVAVYLWRFGPRLWRVRWWQRTPERHFAFSAIFIVVNVAILSYLIVSFVSGAYGEPPDFRLIPPWTVFAMDHAMFIGVMSNALFGLIQAAASERRSFWPWVDDVLFWGMNLGMVGFVISLLANARQLEVVFTPIMGGSILLAIIVYTIRLQIVQTRSTKGGGPAGETG